MRTPNPLREYGWVTYWPERGGIKARFRGWCSDLELWFATIAEFRKAARYQLRNKLASETTAEEMSAWVLIHCN